jgi:glutathione S-transferase
VQRAVVLLKEKEVDFDVTYIDLKNKPDWFLRLSPLGKVPVLKVGDAVLFESLVICEYLDETNPPSLHPADPLRRAVNRAWSEFSGELLVDLYRLSLAQEAAEMETQRLAAREKLERLQGVLGDGPFFNGPRFALVDAAFAPVFMRIDLLQHLYPLHLLAELPGVQRWSEALLAREGVQTSVAPEFPRLFRDYLLQAGGFVGRGAER